MTVQRCITAAFIVVLATSVCHGLWWKPSSSYMQDKHNSMKQTPNVPDTCTKARPCYNVTLIYVMEEKQEKCDVFSGAGPNPERFFKHYAKVGLGKADIIAIGKRAAHFFKQQTGFDFTALPDDAYIYGMATMNNGTVTFTTDTANNECNRRLSIVQFQDKSQVFNQPVDVVFWVILFNAETKVEGRLNKVIPAGASLAFGTNLIESPCKGHKNCKNILFPDNPEKPIFFEVQNMRYFFLYEPGPFVTINCYTFHEEWGWGSARGNVWLPDGSDDGFWDGISVIRFPWKSEPGPNGILIPADV